MQKLFHSLYICKDLVLVCYRNYRYPGCTTRTSVPSQPTALQKPSYKKEPYLQNKNTTTTTAAPHPTPPPPPPQPTPSPPPNPRTPPPPPPPNPTQPKGKKNFN